MSFILITILSVAFVVLAIHKLAALTAARLHWRALLACALCAIAIDLALPILSIYLPDYKLIIIILVTLVAAYYIAGYNMYLLRFAEAQKCRRFFPPEEQAAALAGISPQRPEVSPNPIVLDFSALTNAMPLTAALPATDSVPTTEPQPELDLMPTAEPQPEPDLMPTAESLPEPDLMPTTEPQPEIDSVPTDETQPEIDSVPTAEPQPEIDSVPTAEPQPELDLMPTAEPQPELDLMPTTEPQPEIEFAPTDEPQPELDSVPTAEPQPEIDFVPTDEPQPEPEFVPEQSDAAFIDGDQQKNIDIAAIITDKLATLEELNDILDYAYELRSNNPSAALLAYNKALSNFPDNDYMPFVIIEIGNIHKLAGEYHDAITVYNKALDLPVLATDEVMKKEFINNIMYLRLLETVLQEHNAINLKYSDIPQDILQLAEARFQAWREQNL